jgi:hypothetical protein
VLLKRVASMGDPEMAFSVADRIVEGQYRIDSQEHWYRNPRARMPRSTTTSSSFAAQPNGLFMSGIASVPFLA